MIWLERVFLPHGDPLGSRPRQLIQNRDTMDGNAFARIAEGATIEVA